MKFAIGKLVSTPGALALMDEYEGVLTTLKLLARYQRGDWGDTCAEDKKLNDAAVKDGDRILAVYKMPNDEVIWIITEWDRSVTTFLLPDEY